MSLGRDILQCEIFAVVFLEPLHEQACIRKVADDGQRGEVFVFQIGFVFINK